MFSNKTHSVRLINKRKEFEGPKYKQYLKKIYYMNKPTNNRNEYFALESLAIDWIFKTIGVKLVNNINLIKKDSKSHERILPNGVICLDQINLYWDTTFLLEDDGIWFIGPATVSSSCIQIKAGKYNIVIQNSEPDEYELSTKECIKFSGPVPILESVNIIQEYGMNSIYISKFKWDNSRVQKANITKNYRHIHYKDYKIMIYDLNILIGVIVSNS